MSDERVPDAPKLAFATINVVGGVAVLGSYVLWLSNPSNDAGALWGSIDGAGRTLYATSMFAAAAGYFLFVPYLLRRDADRTPFAWINLLLALVLFPSALWMPLAFEYLDGPSAAGWWAMRGTLGVVGLASLGLVGTLARLRPASPGRALAVVGALAFTFQTLVLDALAWPLCFPR